MLLRDLLLGLVWAILMLMLRDAVGKDTPLGQVFLIASFPMTFIAGYFAGKAAKSNDDEAGRGR